MEIRTRHYKKIKMKRMMIHIENKFRAGNTWFRLSGRTRLTSFQEAIMFKIIVAITFFMGVHFSLGIVRRCYSCRSRGELGSCKDPFRINSTLVEKEKGVEAVPCASGWCSKIIEGGNTDDYGIATERQCLSRGPSDSEERCAKTEWNHKKVYMCFCQGDLCNSSSSISVNYLAFISVVPMLTRILL